MMTKRKTTLPIELMKDGRMLRFLAIKESESWNREESKYLAVDFVDDPLCINASANSL